MHVAVVVSESMGQVRGVLLLLEDLTVKTQPREKGEVGLGTK